MAPSGTVLAAALAAAMLATATAQFQFQFDDMFGGQGGDGGDPFGGQGGHPDNGEPRGPEPVEKGYLCKATADVVDHPRQCPCPGHKMVKCKLGDWYGCYPAGTKCPEGKFSKLDDPAEDLELEDIDEYGDDE
mmetsp:Transcript_36283/g.95062  ORF Transcript_36283/g.95062 Transcript_36283/m.95062 type:complete len:133 (+) Transcript_36283:203-601(+)|eukprot:CAMPEP_0182918178 /NCGR_PEP_ID=MMETSP0105_2-20130417/1938_1 /TAXON_ID=81532 ORGANISM="Acanthoeca-like sp., Strain 10tr" /NCGR_SAMPLE_ID=MMETSP0105_2 /ASSEMBLY_ACC=CAM_ASM_000205 /LENGTH=132 /DNA_ID=CAMNT_0025055237 /DNA_START=202 /DNA_END=600 /DNA_ORIENTATION=+